MVYCLIPYDLAAELHEPLREFFRDDPEVRVVVDCRRSDRRRAPRRSTRGSTPAERRVVQNVDGRRVDDRRASAHDVPARALPPEAEPYADRIVFVESHEPSARQVEDADSGRLVIRAQQGDTDAVSQLYLRYFEPLYSYLKPLLRDPHEAEDVVQDVFAQVLTLLPRYEIRAEQPFRVLLYRIARNRSVDHFRKTKRSDLADPIEMRRLLEAAAVDDPAVLVERLSDTELSVFLRRLPETQLHVLLLRYMLDFTPEEIAAVVGTTPDGARALQYRALQRLRKLMQPRD
ncbi:MAG TPA: sigma-70 family RNA polymerase sigma factor [Solirubrobacteraceae bacterium]|nr:sigma-70 family RNA polymerase sigma factor [Solirubrobacteraceae bacterium]